jgi:hypothetical protein
MMKCQCCLRHRKALDEGGSLLHLQERLQLQVIPPIALYGRLLVPLQHFSKASELRKKSTRMVAFVNYPIFVVVQEADLTFPNRDVA